MKVIYQTIYHQHWTPVVTIQNNSKRNQQNISTPVLKFVYCSFIVILSLFALKTEKKSKNLKETQKTQTINSRRANIFINQFYCEHIRWRNFICGTNLKSDSRFQRFRFVTSFTSTIVTKTFSKYLSTSSPKFKNS